MSKSKTQPPGGMFQSWYDVLFVLVLLALCYATVAAGFLLLID